MILSLLLSLFLQQPIKPSDGPTDRPNVIFIVLDDVGYRDIEEVETPNIDALANAGRNFTRGYAMPSCAPTRRTLMFGEYAESSGPICVDTANWQTPSTSWLSLPKVFEQRYYNTAFFGKWHLGTNDLGMPWEQTPQLHGFDSVFAMVTGNVSAACDGFEGDYYEWLAVENGVSYVETRYQTLVLRDKFIEWWSTVRGPKFAMVSLQAAHAPFDEPPLELQPYAPSFPNGNRRAFEKLVISADVAIGQILSVVDLKNTYVVLIGDNGTPPNACMPDQNRNRVKGTVYEGGIHVPFLVFGPGIVPGASSAIVSVVDILPTLADLVGVDSQVIDGISLLPVIKNPAINVREFIFASQDKNRTVVQDRFKLIRLQNIERFYDLSTDPNELQSLNPDLMDPMIVAALRKTMKVYINRGL